MGKTKQQPAAVVRKAIAVLRAQTGWTPSGLINLLRGGGSSSKGSSYERDMCRKLSLWWTEGEREDIFWRSAGSGARAKVRGRAGASTAGQHGDVAATDPIGAPLIDAFTIELKRGYSEYTMQDMIDRDASGGIQVYEDFFSQTIESYEQAGSLSWLLITRRDRRQAIAWVPHHTLTDLRRLGCFVNSPLPFARIKVAIRNSNKEGQPVTACGVLLDHWLSAVTPQHVKRLLEL